MTTQNIYDLADTWNAGATTFTAIKMNVTDTASNAASLLMDLQVGGSSRFNVGKTGSLKLGVSPTGTNQAGTNVIIAGSQGTGTGAGGSIVFQVAPAGSSGSAQNALVDALTIDAGNLVRLRPASTTGSLLTSGDNGFRTLQLLGQSYGSNGVAAIRTDNFVAVRGSGGFAWENGSNNPATGTLDLILARDAANTLALRNGANAQTFRVYNTYDGTNDERLSIYWAGNNAYMLTGAIGTGVNRDLSIGTSAGNASLNFWTNAATRWKIDGANGHFLAGTDNTFDIGASGANRPRNIYAAGQVVGSSHITAGANAYIAWDGRLLLYSPASDRLALGGTTSSFPALKRSSTTLQARLADDSAFASVQGKLTTDTAYAAGDPTTTGYLVVYDSTGTAYKIPAVAV